MKKLIMLLIYTLLVMTIVGILPAIVCFLFDRYLIVRILIVLVDIIWLIKYLSEDF